MVSVVVAFGLSYIYIYILSNIHNSDIENNGHNEKNISVCCCFCSNTRNLYLVVRKIYVKRRKRHVVDISIIIIIIIFWSTLEIRHFHGMFAYHWLFINSLTFTKKKISILVPSLYNFTVKYIKSSLWVYVYDSVA